MQNVFLEICRSCLKQDVPLFETMEEDKPNYRKVENNTIIRDLFPTDFIEDEEFPNWKLCEGCSVLLKGAVVFKRGLLSSQLVYNNWLRILKYNIHRSATVSNLSVQKKDLREATYIEDAIKVKNETVEEGTEYVAGLKDGCVTTEKQLDIESIVTDITETEGMKCEIDECNFEKVINNNNSEMETTIDIKIETEKEIVVESSVVNSEMRQIGGSSNQVPKQVSAGILHDNKGTTIDTDEDTSDDNDDAKATNSDFEAKSFQCLICKQEFAEKLILVIHLRTHSDAKSYKYHRQTYKEEEKPYKCTLCAKTFSHKSHYCKHQRNHRSREKPYFCDMCAKTFSQKEHCDKHMRIHTGEKPYKCDLCAKAFSQISNYNKHRKIHTGEKPYLCDVCAKAFSQKAHYDTHRRIHMGEKPYKCDLCAKAFSQKSSYNAHRRIHTGEKPYKCDLCAKAFSQISSYHTHRRIHTGEKPYLCDLCAKTFSQKAHYDTHRRIHMGEKPYKCDFCAKTFAQKSHRDSHRRIHTRKTVQM